MGRPLDEQQANLYGQFVNAVYAMFKRDRNLLRPEPASKDIPAPYELVAWINMSDFNFWGKEIPKFYGIICRHPEQRNFVLAIRGTEGAVEWFDDAMAFLVPFRHAPDAGKVARGFNKVYDTLRVVRRRGAMAGAPAAKVTGGAQTGGEAEPESFAKQLERLATDLEEPAPQAQTQAVLPRRSFAVTGHSLGSALATLFVLDHREERKFDVTTICTFASPHVGNAEFVSKFDELQLTSWRIVNTQDIVPKVPLRLPFFDYQHVATPNEFSSAGEVKWSPACWHSMCTYLHWLDPNKNKVDDDCKP